MSVVLHCWVGTAVIIFIVVNVIVIHTSLVGARGACGCVRARCSCVRSLVPSDIYYMKQHPSSCFACKKKQ